MYNVKIFTGCLIISALILFPPLLMSCRNNSRDRDNTVNIFKAVKNNDLLAIEELLDKGININIKDNQGRTALFYAKIDAAKLLIKKGADINVKDNNHNIPLHLIAEDPNLYELAHFHILNDANVNANNINFCTPMHNAIQNNNLKIFRLLLEKRSNINAMNTDGISPLSILVSKDKYLLGLIYFFDTHLKSHEINAEIEFIKLINITINNNCSLNQPINNITKRLSPLMYAISEKYNTAAFIIINCGADVNKPTLAGETPLHFAVVFNQKKIVKYLLDNGANINAKDKFGRTPFDRIPFGNSDPEILQLLFDYGLDINIKGENGKGSILHTYVSFFRDGKHCEVLIKNGADVNIRDEIGFTPLHLSAEQNKDKIVTLLLKYGADVNAKDIYGRTPLVVASSSEIIKILLEAKEKTRIKE